MRRKRWILPLLAALLATVLVACGTGAPPGPAESPVIIPDTTKVLSDTSRTSLQSYDPTTGELRFGPQADFATLKAGDVLVTQPLPPLAPYGFLRKVVSVSTVGQDTVVETVPAKLTEAIHQGAAQLQQQLTPSMLTSSVLAQGVTLQSAGSSQLLTLGLNNVVIYDADGNTSTTNDQVRASGSFTLNPVLNVAVGFHFHFCCEVQSRFKFAIGVKQSTQVSVTAAAGVNVNKEFDLGSMTFSTITIMVGPVPVVFVPKLQIVADFKGSVSAKLTFTAREDLTLVAGTEKPYGHGFHDISTAKLTGSSNAGNLFYKYPSVTFDMKPDVGARFQILVYDLIGPQAKLDAYVEVKGQMPGDPVWQAYAGIEGYLGLHVAVLDFNWDKKIFDKSIKIGQQTGNLPPVVTTDDVNPADGSTVQIGVPVEFNVQAGDPEDGAIFKGVWTDGSGQPFPLDANNQHTFTKAGPYAIKVTVKDSAGATASVTTHVTVVDTPPVATLSSPNYGTTMYVDHTQPKLLGSAVDANEPGGTLSCDRLTWSSSPSDADLPADGCPPVGSQTGIQLATFHSTGTYEVTLTATDPQGKTDAKTATVTVLPTPASYPPSPTIAEPGPGASFGDSEPLALSANIEDSDSSNVIYKWYLFKGLYIGTNPPVGTVIASGTATNVSAAGPQGVPISDTYPGLGCTQTDVPYTLWLEASDGTNTALDERTISCTFIPR